MCNFFLDDMLGSIFYEASERGSDSGDLDVGEMIFQDPKNYLGLGLERQATQYLS